MSLVQELMQDISIGSAAAVSIPKVREGCIYEDNGFDAYSTKKRIQTISEGLEGQYSP
jgi:hypothetical protein